MVSGNDQGGRVECFQHSTRRPKLMSKRALGQVPAHNNQIHVGSVNIPDKRINNGWMTNPAKVNIRNVSYANQIGRLKQHGNWIF